VALLCLSSGDGLGDMIFNHDDSLSFFFFLNFERKLVAAGEFFFPFQKELTLM